MYSCSKADNTFQHVPFCQNLTLCTLKPQCGLLEGSCMVLSTWLLPVALTIASTVTESHQASVVWSKTKLLTESWETDCCCKKQYKPTTTTMKQPRYWTAFKFINAPGHGSNWGERNESTKLFNEHDAMCMQCEDEQCRLFHLNPCTSTLHFGLHQVNWTLVQQSTRKTQEHIINVFFFVNVFRLEGVVLCEGGSLVRVKRASINFAWSIQRLCSRLVHLLLNIKIHTKFSSCIQKSHLSPVL